MEAKQFKRQLIPLFNSWEASGKTDQELLKRVINFRDAHPEQDWDDLGLGQQKAKISEAEERLSMKAS